jgi:hypothetical protein
MSKGYTLEYGPESRAFSEMSVAAVMAQWCSMSSVPQIAKPDAFRRIRLIQTVTIVWMTVEAAVSLAAAWMARSPALLAFGGDSAIELLSAIVVLWRCCADRSSTVVHPCGLCVRGVRTDTSGIR